MGDRANIRINEHIGSDDDRFIYLYSHWDGHDLWKILQNALSRKQRWTDPPYLARIIFCEMIKDDVMGETGYGIATYECDNEYPYLTVDCSDQMVEVNGIKIPFQKYVGLTKDPREQ